MAELVIRSSSSRRCSRWRSFCALFRDHLAMRYQGRIIDWNNDRGFGFIAPNGGGAKVFLHFRALQKGERRPGGDELVTYEVDLSGPKGPRAVNVAYVDRSKISPRRPASAEREGNGVAGWIRVAIVVVLAVVGWQQYTAKRDVTVTPATTPIIEQVAPGSTPSTFKCEGKTYCSQMTSCEEATFYLRNCPGVEIDGDRDGIPCEKQHCNK
ncbi:MAG: cold shock domain-containing protein [Betaproteobacteria bacterium]